MTGRREIESAARISAWCKIQDLCTKRGAIPPGCIRRQFGNDRRCFTFERRAPCEVAGQCCCERFRTFKGGGYSGRVPRLAASPVPCRAADTFRKPRLLCGPSRHDAVRPSPTLRAQTVLLAPFLLRQGYGGQVRVCLFRCRFQGQKVPPYSSYAPKGGRTSGTSQKMRRAGALSFLRLHHKYDKV
jgi:hypothetical protein